MYGYKKNSGKPATPWYFYWFVTIFILQKIGLFLIIIEGRKKNVKIRFRLLSKKNITAIYKLGGGGKALMALPLSKDFILRLP